MTTALNGYRPVLGAQNETPTAPTVRASGGQMSFDHTQDTTTANGHASPRNVGVLDLLRSYVVMMTPTHARYIVEHQMWDRQRNLRPVHVAYLVSAIDNAELWRLILEFAEFPDGSLRLVDGQHRLNALIRSGQTLPAVVIVSRVADEREAARLYASIDRQKTRTMIDALRAYAIVTDTEISLETLSKISGGVALLSSRFARDYAAQTRSQISRAAMLEQWLPEAETFLGYLRGTSKEAWNLMTRSSVTAVALVTIREQPTLAEQFWRDIAMDDGLKHGDARHALLKWLRANPVRSHPNVVVYAQYVALAWNHFFAGTSLEKMIVKNRAAPIRILGTSFTGKSEDE